MKTMRTLVLDDDARMGQLVGDILKRDGIVPVITDDSREAISILRKQDIDMVITDLKMPHVGGIGVLEHAKGINPETVVIIITGFGSIESAIEAVKKGAYDYIEKPFEPDEFSVVVRRAREYVRLLHENRVLQREIDGCRDDDIIGTSKVVSGLKDLIDKVARFDTTVLIEGETGTGKELVARLIHRGSGRKQEKLLPVNCGALSEPLLESELFGYEKGAFTGADRQKKGLFEAAQKGTIFLDEINATSSNFQVKLLRVLQEGALLRVGGTESVSVDVRVIAASNTSLEREVEEGRFRKDLFYRLNVVTIEIPPLRKRKEDIPSLAYHFLNKFSRKYGKLFAGIAPETLKKLIDYSWPGNVRELENVIERAMIMESGGELQSVHVPKKTSGDANCDDYFPGLSRLDDMEETLIRRTLESLQGQRAKAAEMLGISTTSLWRKIKKYGLE